MATANLDTNLNLSEIGIECRNTQYNPRRFAALIMRQKEPVRTTALIFKNGKMVITGAKSEQDSREAAKQYTRAIKNATGDNSIQLKEFKVQNMVASAQVDYKIELEGLVHSEH